MRWQQSFAAVVAILTNDGGVGVLASDALIDAGGTLAVLSAEPSLNSMQVLPARWSRANPIDIIADADAERYTAAVCALLRAPESVGRELPHAGPVPRMWLQRGQGTA